MTEKEDREKRAEYIRDHIARRKRLLASKATDRIQREKTYNAKREYWNNIKQNGK